MHLKQSGGTLLLERTWDNHDTPQFLSWYLNSGYPKSAEEFRPLYCKIRLLNFHRNVIPVWLIIWDSIYFAVITMWLMTWCLKNTSSWNVDVLPVLRHEAVTWVTCFIYWLPLLQMKCPLYPLNMSVLHLELNVPWAKVVWMSCKENISHHCHCGSEGILFQTIHCTEHMERNPLNGWWHSHLYLLLYSFPASSGVCCSAQSTCC